MPGDWLTPTEAKTTFGFRGNLLQRLRQSRHHTLGRKIHYKQRPAVPESNREYGHGFVYWREDLEKVHLALQNPPRDRFTDEAGIVWVAHRVATAKPFAFSLQRLMRWAKRCPLLGVDRIEALRTRREAVYKRRGKILVWYFQEEQLRQIRANLDAGRVLSKIHGPGLTLNEATSLGFSRSVLERWSDVEGRGIVELGGGILASWKEYRISPHEHVTAYRVFDGQQLQRVLDSRKQAGKHPEGLSAREAMQRYQSLFHNGELAQWRKHCHWLGRPLEAWKVLSKWGTRDNAGEWRYSRADLEAIAQSLRKAQPDAPYEDPGSGKRYLPLRAFVALAGMAEQNIAHYREQNHKALGRPLDYIYRPWPSRRNKYSNVYLYLEEDGRRIAEWKRERRTGQPARPVSIAKAPPVPSAANITNPDEPRPAPLPQQGYAICGGEGPPVRVIIVGKEKDGDETLWSRPESTKTWAKVFNISRNTMYARLKEQTFRNKKVGSLYAVAIADIPAPHRQRFQDPPPK